MLAHQFAFDAFETAVRSERTNDFDLGAFLRTVLGHVLSQYLRFAFDTRDALHPTDVVHVLCHRLRFDHRICVSVQFDDQQKRERGQSKVNL